MIEMKKRQDREELKQYYLKMIKGNKEFCAEKGSNKEMDFNTSGVKCFVPIHRDLKSKHPSGQIIYLGRNPYKED